MAISTITAFEELWPLTGISKGQVGVLALDFDNTIGESTRFLFSEPFYNRMRVLNALCGLPKDFHYAWTEAGRSHVEYRNCEQGVERVLADFDANGWKIIVVTSRGANMSETTSRHLRQCGIGQFIEKAHHKLTLKGTGSKKSDYIIEYVKGLNAWRLGLTCRLLFVDDLRKHCEDVETVAERLDSVVVTTFHIRREECADEWSDIQLRNLLVQLHDYIGGAAIRTDQPKVD